MLWCVCSQQLILEEVKESEIIPTPGLYLPTSPVYRFSDEGDSFPFLLNDLDTAEAQVTSLSGGQVFSEPHSLTRTHNKATVTQNVSHKKATVLLEALANNNNHTIDPKASLEFVKLARILRAASGDVTENLWAKYSHLQSHR